MRTNLAKSMFLSLEGSGKWFVKARFSIGNSSDNNFLQKTIDVCQHYTNVNIWFGGPYFYAKHILFTDEQKLIFVLPQAPIDSKCAHECFVIIITFILPQAPKQIQVDTQMHYFCGWLSFAQTKKFTHILPQAPTAKSIVHRNVLSHRVFNIFSNSTSWKSHLFCLRRLKKSTCTQPSVIAQTSVDWGVLAALLEN